MDDILTALVSAAIGASVVLALAVWDLARRRTWLIRRRWRARARRVIAATNGKGGTY